MALYVHQSLTDNVCGSSLATNQNAVCFSGKTKGVIHLYSSTIMEV